MYFMCQSVRGVDYNVNGGMRVQMSAHDIHLSYYYTHAAYFHDSLSSRVFNKQHYCHYHTASRTQPNGMKKKISPKTHSHAGKGVYN